MRRFRCWFLVASVLAAAAATAVASPPQSPITFLNPAGAFLHVPQFNYPALVDLTLTTLNHSAGAVPAKKKIEGTLTNPMVDAASLTINTDTYKLKEMHLHHGQEHVLGANNYPLELHLVHEHSTNGSFLAVGLWIEPTLSIGAENAALAQILANLPAGPNVVDDPDQTASFANFKLPDLLPSDGNNFFRYNGSLTTFKTNAEAAANMGAGVSETAVTWIFYKDPLKLMQANINTFAAHPAMTGARAPFVMNPNTHMLQEHVVPEPSTVWLLAVTGLVVAGRRRRD